MIILGNALSEAGGEQHEIIIERRVESIEQAYQSLPE